MSEHLSTGGRRDYKESLLKETREELQKADTKASILLAASGIALSALLTAVASNTWYPGKVRDDSARSLVWIAALFAVLGVCLMGAAVKPRMRMKTMNRQELHYFGNVESYWPSKWTIRGRAKAIRRARAAFGDVLAEASTNKNYDDRLDDQIWYLSHVAYRKYRLVSLGLWLYAAALAAGLLALAAERF